MRGHSRWRSWRCSLSRCSATRLLDWRASRCSRAAADSDRGLIVTLPFGLALNEAPSSSPRSGQAATRPVAVTFAGLLALVVGAYHVVDGVVVLVGGGDESELAEGAFEIVLGLVVIA